MSYNGTGYRFLCGTEAGFVVCCVCPTSLSQAAAEEFQRRVTEAFQEYVTATLGSCDAGVVSGVTKAHRFVGFGEWLPPSARVLARWRMTAAALWLALGFVGHREPNLPPHPRPTFRPFPAAPQTASCAPSAAASSRRATGPAPRRGEWRASWSRWRDSCGRT